VQLADLIRQADKDDRMWALLIEHQNASLELHDHDQTAMMVLDRPATEEGLADYLLVPDPVTCNDAVTAGVVLLSVCDRCSAV
jgi:hypothetical protein